MEVRSLFLNSFFAAISFIACTGNPINVVLNAFNTSMVVDLATDWAPHFAVPAEARIKSARHALHARVARNCQFSCSCYHGFTIKFNEAAISVVSGANVRMQPVFEHGAIRVHHGRWAVGADVHARKMRHEVVPHHEKHENTVIHQMFLYKRLDSERFFGYGVCVAVAVVV